MIVDVLYLISVFVSIKSMLQEAVREKRNLIHEHCPTETNSPKKVWGPPTR
jgi:hypothetical protein